MDVSSLIKGVGTSGMVFLVIEVVVGVLGLFACIRKDEKTASVCSGLVTSLGVLGTFVGIAAGLYDFNTQEVASSVPDLLEGMKFAFVTSILGMFFSIAIKVMSTVLDYRKKDEDIDDVVELFNRMSSDSKELNSTLIANQNKTNDIFLKLSEMLTNNQNDIKDEINVLNRTVDGKNNILIEEFRNFGKQMAINNTSALIDALNDVIKDFNVKITEQFGDNFKELNIAVGKLLEWQDKYKDILELTTKNLEVVTESVQNVDKSLNSISSSSDKLLESSESIFENMESVKISQNDVNKVIGSISEIVNNVNESMPSLDSYFKGIGENISDVTNNLELQMKNSIESVDNHMEMLAQNISTTCSKTMEDFSNDIGSSYKTFTSSLKEFTNRVGNTVELSNEQIKAQCDTLSKTNSEIGKVLELQLTELNEETSRQILKIVEQMENVFADRVDKVNNMLEYELKKSLNTLGQALFTLSNKFVEDYTPLTEKLKEVVNISKGA